GSVGAERRERSRCATELDDEDSRRGLVQSLEVSDQWRRPYRAFETEGSRDRVLQMGAARHRRVAKARGSIGENACQRDQVAPHYRKRATDLQDKCGVQNVLSGRTKMDVARGFVPRDSAQFFDDRDYRIANSARAVGNVVEPQVLDSGCAPD